MRWDRTEAEIEQGAIGRLMSRVSEAAPVTSVEVHDLQWGDRLAGVPGQPAVGSLVYVGPRGWVIGDDHGIEIVRRPLGARVQIVAGERQGKSRFPVSIPTPATPDADVECGTGNDRKGDPFPALSDSTTASGGEACLAPAMTLPAASTDDCPPHGITRSHGLWLVTP